jgi:hypothetical protein
MRKNEAPTIKQTPAIIIKIIPRIVILRKKMIPARQAIINPIKRVMIPTKSKLSSGMSFF